MENFDATNQDFALRHVWITCVSAFDLYMTEMVSEVGIRLIDRDPPTLTNNLRQVSVRLESMFGIEEQTPAERLLFFRDSIYSTIQYKSFYRPDGVSEALSYVWTCPAKEKWARVLSGMQETGRYLSRTEQDIRAELTLIGDRRDLIAHSMDTPPGAQRPNPVSREDAASVIEFFRDIVNAIDAETERQL
ncbi:hypothetical protein [Rhodovulum sp. MB263]|uniref:hypothetical protein n=1 Tax=Rhodovulum sp. (strain MB263) TaxID=308754 RepID=UPI0012DB0866|nr:hypothetical protein [Rhodovulum sp. MB263]